MKSFIRKYLVAKIDKIKELIGYLKVVLGILIAIDVSIVGWLFKNEEHLSNLKIALSSFAVIIVTLGAIIVNKKILKEIDKLEEL